MNGHFEQTNCPAPGSFLSSRTEREVSEYYENPVNQRNEQRPSVSDVQNHDPEKNPYKATFSPEWLKKLEARVGSLERAVSSIAFENVDLRNRLGLTGECVVDDNIGSDLPQSDPTFNGVKNQIEVGYEPSARVDEDEEFGPAKVYNSNTRTLRDLTEDEEDDDAVKIARDLAAWGGDHRARLMEIHQRAKKLFPQ